MGDNTSTQRDRLNTLAVYLDMSVRKLAQFCNLSTATVYHITDNSSFVMSPRTASRICFQLEKQKGLKVNKNWLLNGEGEMILKENENTSISNNQTKPDAEKKQKTLKTDKKKKDEENEELFIENIIRILKNNYNLVLTGAPGTGKTTLAQEIAKKMGAETRFVQFHPSYDYTDFVEGVRPIEKGNGEMGFERKDGVFKAFCKKAIEDSQKKFVCIIDEINRGETSKIFGELFYALEPSNRGKKDKDKIVQTQYQNLVPEADVFAKGFFVPENVYILATMNDIDRSVESMDFAMRRRFTWKEVTPDDTQYMLDELDKKLPKYADEAKATMKRLNKAIAATDGLGTAYSVGPSYFLKLEVYGGDYDILWTMNIEPLLKEYLRGFRKAKEILEKFSKAYFNEKEATQELIDEN